MSNKAIRDRRVEKAQMRVLFTVPFFAPGVARLPVVWDDSIPTAATNGEVIKWNPQWFDKLRDEELVTVLCHEVCHPLLGHLWRMPQGGDWDLWNQATDHAVNNMLKEFSKTVMAGRVADPFPFPDPQDAYCADPSFADVPEERIYETLSKRPKAKSGRGGGSQGQGKGGKTPQKGQGTPEKGSMPSFGEMEKPKSSNSQEQAKQKSLKNDWDSTLIQAVQMSKGRGDLPAGFERFVDQLVNPSVPWSQVLRSWLAEQAADDWDFTRPDMTMEGSGFILPSMHSERMGPIIFATDTSGSIDATLLATFQAEKQSCLDEMRPSKLVDIYCDAQIHKVQEYTPGDTITHHAPGGGGTAFEPVFDWAAKQSELPKAVVYLTDLCGSFPVEPPPYPVVWVTWEKGRNAPFGEVIYAGA